MPHLTLTIVPVLAAASPALTAFDRSVDPFVFHLAIFVLAAFAGCLVVSKATRSQHTPLIAATNAISSIVIVGALLAVGASSVIAGSPAAKFLGFLALIMASINIFGGFLVTHRMLAMYRKKEP